MYIYIDSFKKDVLPSAVPFNGNFINFLKIKAFMSLLIYIYIYSKCR